MRILTLVSSYRKRGNTARIVAMIEAHLAAEASATGEGLELERLHLGDLDMRPCRGCRACFDRGEAACPLQDDIPAITEKLRAADGIILASPVYVDDVNGVAKTLIDRLAFMCHRPELAEKCVALVATVGDSPTGRTLHTMGTAFRLWGATIVGQAGFKAGALMAQDEIETRYEARTAEIAGLLVRAIEERRFRCPSFLALMTFKIQQVAWRKGDPDTVDYAYWAGRGWLDPGRTFYIATDTRPLKVGLARLVGGALAPFVT